MKGRTSGTIQTTPRGANMWKKLISGMAMAAVLIAPAFAADETSTWDGLQKVKSKRVDSAYLLPGADFRIYGKVMLDPIQVSFAKNWQRDMNRSTPGASQRVSTADADRIRQEMSEGFRETLVKSFQKAGYEVVEAPGPDVLRVTPVLVDVYVNAPDTIQAGRSYTYTLEAGQATMALEVRDAETGQLLGRAVDKRRTGETGTFQWTTRVTNRAEFQRVFDRWAQILADGMDSLKEQSPIAATAPKK
jgi:hypothetical protein